MADERRLTRSESDRMVAGVCGGLAEFFGVDPTIVRIAFVVLTVFGGSGVVLYLVLWLIVPRASKPDLPPRDVVRDSFDEGRKLVEEGAEAAKRTYQRLRGEQTDESTGGAGGGSGGSPQSGGPQSGGPQEPGPGGDGPPEQGRP